MNQEIKGRGNETTKAQQQRDKEDENNKLATTLKIEQPESTSISTGTYDIKAAPWILGAAGTLQCVRCGESSAASNVLDRYHRR